MKIEWASSHLTEWNFNWTLRARLGFNLGPMPLWFRQSTTICLAVLWKSAAPFVRAAVGLIERLSLNFPKQLPLVYCSTGFMILLASGVRHTPQRSAYRKWKATEEIIQFLFIKHFTLRLSSCWESDLRYLIHHENLSIYLLDTNVWKCDKNI